jgi:hypothetical protein
MELWVGLAGLKANPKSKSFRRFGKGKGAYVHVAAWAETPAAFEERVRRAADELDCILVDLDDVELLETEMDRDEVPEQFTDMLRMAKERPGDAVFGDFHIWHEDEAN